MNLNKFKSISEIFGIWVTLVGILSAGIFAVIEYQNHNKLEQRKNTIEMFKEFNNENYYSTRKKLASSESDGNVILRNRLSNVKKDAVNLIYTDLLLERIRKDKISQEIDKIMLFLEGVAVCSYTQICDYKSTYDFFLNHGRSFFHTYYPYICMERKRWSRNSIGMILEKFYSKKSERNICKTAP